MEADPWAAIVNQLLPHVSSTERERLGLRLAEQASARLTGHWHALIGDRPALHALALDAPGFDPALPALALSLTWPAALMLLAGDLADQTTIALASPVAAVRESAIEALVSDAPLLQFDRACRAICEAHLTALLERLPAADSETYDRALRGDDHAVHVEPIAPIPTVTHQSATEPALMAALRSGDNQHAIRLLAAAALVSTESIETAISLRSRRGLVSLAWKAGFSMRAAVLLQTELGGFPACAVLTATSDGSCPLNRSEMVWQIGFLARKLI
ncbi:MAG: hypothetical protein ACRYGI_03905 [Janthinobacterium lividum]